jgi:hypothetical protein
VVKHGVAVSGAAVVVRLVLQWCVMVRLSRLVRSRLGKASLGSQGMSGYVVSRPVLAARVSLGESR